MKTLKTLLIVNLLFICTLTFAQNEKKLALNMSKTVGIFQFDSEIIDYGTIKQKTDGTRNFIFKNTGNAPIIITKVKGSCGCTVATKPDQPIMPGQTAKIGVKYDTKRLGSFSKTITVTSNASESRKIIKITGKIVK